MLSLNLDELALDLLGQVDNSDSLRSVDDISPVHVWIGGMDHQLFLPVTLVFAFCARWLFTLAAFAAILLACSR